MLGVFGTVALTLGLVSGVPPREWGLRAAASTLVLANGVAVVFEYEADVPQFTEALYLPALLAAVLSVAYGIDRLVPHRLRLSLVVSGYAATRLAATAGLTALDRSAPDLPIAILGLAAWDLPFRSRPERALAAATAMSWLASATELASPSADALVPMALVVTTAFSLVLASRLSRRAAGAATVLVFGVLLPWSTPDPAAAHDPGQGAEVAAITLTGAVSGREITLSASVAGHCDDLRPSRVMARRAGETVKGPLRSVAGAYCTFEGALAVPADGRWFTYVELTHDGATVAAWLPLDAGDSNRSTEARALYKPAGGSDGSSTWQIALADRTGGLLYALGAVVVLVGIRTAGLDKRAQAGSA